MRYEKKSTIITTNIPLSKLGETFSNNTIVSAILDRLVHHSTIIKITGKSYRLKGKIDSIERSSKTASNEDSI
jgi:DNA replication protein DnaC